MTVTTIFLFALTELTISVSPGPAVLLVVSQGMNVGFKGSLRGVLGIITGELFFFALSAMGLGTLLLASQSLFMIIKWLGAGYIVCLGCKLIIISFKTTTPKKEHAPAIHNVKLFRQGLLMQLGNPKAILFFTAILPQFINTELPATIQFIVLGLVSITVQGTTLSVYGWLSEKGGDLLKQGRFAKWLDRIAGGLLIGAGLKLAINPHQQN